MTQYLISFNDEWVPEHTEDELRAKAVAGWSVIDEMKAAGVFIFSNGALDASTTLCSVESRDGAPVVTDGPYVESKEHLGGFAVVDVPDDAAARYWAGRLAVALDWPQEVHRFPSSQETKRPRTGSGRPRYLLSVFGPAERGEFGPYSSREEMLQAYEATGAFNDRLEREGRVVFVDGLEPATTATTVDGRRGENPVVTDGPYLESKEHLGGFWVVEADDLDEALVMAGNASRACGNVVEVRPFHTEPED